MSVHIGTIFLLLPDFQFFLCHKISNDKFLGLSSYTHLSHYNDSGALDFGTSFTVSVWIYWDDLTPSATLIMKSEVRVRHVRIIRRSN